MREVCRHCDVQLVELHDIDKQNGHPSIAGMKSICEQLLEQVAEIAPGELMLNMRDNRKTGRAVYVTKDMGRTWTPHASDGQLVEPVCMASLLKVRASENALKRDILLFSNPADANDRKNITIQLSLDGGETWTRKCLLDEGEGWGYSCLTMIDRKTVGILYESSQAHMTFQAVPLKDIR